MNNYTFEWFIRNTNYQTFISQFQMYACFIAGLDYCSVKYSIK